MLHDDDESSSSSDDDAGFLVTTKKTPRSTDRSVSVPQASRADNPRGSLSRNGADGPKKYKTFDLGDAPPQDSNFLCAPGGYDTASSRQSSIGPHSRSVSPEPGEVGDFVVVSKGMFGLQ